MNRADEDYLYPRPEPRDVNVYPLTLENISSEVPKFFEARVLTTADDNGKFQTLYDEVVMFEERDDMNMVMKVSSDFLRSNVNFILIHVDSGHHFVPQHTFEDAKKLVLP